MDTTHNVTLSENELRLLIDALDAQAETMDNGTPKAIAVAELERRLLKILNKK